MRSARARARCSSRAARFRCRAKSARHRRCHACDRTAVTRPRGCGSAAACATARRSSKRARGRPSTISSIRRAASRAARRSTSSISPSATTRRPSSSASTSSACSTSSRSPRATRCSARSRGASARRSRAQLVPRRGELHEAYFWNTGGGAGLTTSLGARGLGYGFVEARGEVSSHLQPAWALGAGASAGVIFGDASDRWRAHLHARALRYALGDPYTETRDRPRSTPFDHRR